MPPAPGAEGGRGVPHGCTKQGHPPATGRCRDEDTAPRPTPLLPAKPLVTYQRRRKRQKEQRQAVTSIPEGPLMTILSVLPYRSLCRFKCVSKEWRTLCSDPGIGKNSLKMQSGFFHNHISDGKLRFHNLNGCGPPLVDPALPYLRGYERFRVQHCSNGVLLCKCWKPGPEGDKIIDLVVCNPTTHVWIVLPPVEVPHKEEYEEEEEEEDEDEEEEEEDGDLEYFEPVEAYLGFDPTFPTFFVVLVLLRGCLDDVAIYTSETRQWIRRGWRYGVNPVATADCVFLNGCMHLMTDEEKIVTADTKGKVWNTIPIPRDMDPSNGRASTSLMGQSQGLLHAWYIDPEEYQLSVWMLEDNKWTPKHSVDVLDLFETIGKCWFEVIAIHPERNVIFITDNEMSTISYDMDKREVHEICNSREFLGGLPYIPFFAQ